MPVAPEVAGAIGFASLNGGTTGGRGGRVVTASSYADLTSQAASAEPTVILVEGRISNGPTGGIVRVVSRTTRAYPAGCSADIPYAYAEALTANADDVRTLVPQGAGVGKL